MAVASGRSDRAEQDRRTEWLELAARAVRADQAARAQRQARGPGRSGGPGGQTARTERMITRSLALADSATGTRPAARAGSNRPAARAAARSAARTVERTAELTRPRSAAGFVVLLVAGSLYGLGMAAVTAVAIARFATAEPLGAVGPVAFIGVAVGFLTLCALILPSVRSRRD